MQIFLVTWSVRMEFQFHPHLERSERETVLSEFPFCSCWNFNRWQCFLLPTNQCIKCIKVNFSATSHMFKNQRILPKYHLWQVGCLKSFFPSAIHIAISLRKKIHYIIGETTSHCPCLSHWYLIYKQIFMFPGNKSKKQYPLCYKLYSTEALPSFKPELNKLRIERLVQCVFKKVQFAMN